MNDIKGLVSIVIPSYNHGHFLQRVLNSVIKQTYQDWEVIIVDNHSSDDTDVVLSTYQDKRIKIFKIHNNGVVAASRNLGITVASGEFVAFLDSDDWWFDNKLEVSLYYLSSGVDLIYHDLWIVNNESIKSVRKQKSRALTKPIFNQLITEGNAIPNSSVVVRRSVLIKAGLLDVDKNLIASEDFDLWLRVSLLTDYFYRIPVALGYYWYAQNNLSKDKDLSVAGTIILAKHKHLLSDNMLSMATGYLRYIEGLHKTSINVKLARQLFIESFKKGSPMVKAKSIFRMVRL